MTTRELISIELEPDEDAALTAWVLGERFPDWRDEHRFLLVGLSERFRRRRRGWTWAEGQLVCEGVALALDRGAPHQSLCDAVDGLAAKARQISPGSVEAFVARACLPRRRR